MSRCRILYLALLVLGAGCVDTPGPAAPITAGSAISAATSGATAQTSGPSFLQPDPNAPPLATRSVSFWAVKGKGRDGRIFYQRKPGESDASELLRFVVPSNSLLRYPNGKLFAKNDSVRITITIVDETKLIADFQPSGLTFDAKDPAELRIWYAKANHDIDRDGDINGTDQAIEGRLRIWKRDGATAPSMKLDSNVDLTAERVRARVILSFTNYAIAY